MNKYLIIACLLLLSLACHFGSPSAQELQNTDAKLILGKLKPIAELVTSDKPLLTEAVKLISGPHCAGEYDHNKYACFEGSGYIINYCKEANNNNEMTTRAEIDIPQVNSGIIFQDIISIFGKWELVGPEGKTSLVKFMYTNPKTKKTAIVFADLYDPPRNPKSPVMGLVIQKFDPGEIK
jgi:hypothetical protein